jgi:hypothetical protein
MCIVVLVNGEKYEEIMVRARERNRRRRHRLASIFCFRQDCSPPEYAEVARIAMSDRPKTSSHMLPLTAG